MQRNLSLDILKFGLAIMIIALHTRFLYDVNQDLSYFLLNGIFRVAVPIFFVINGYYFVRALSAPLSWFKRGIILYLIWMLIYSYYWLHPSSENFIWISKAIKNLLVGYVHLWYLASMVGAALMLYCLRNLSSTLLLALSLCLYLLGVTIQYIANYHVFNGSPLDALFNTYWIYRSTLFFAFPFFCFGYLIAKHQVHKKINPSIVMLAVAIGCMLLVGESYINLHNTAKPEEFDLMYMLLPLCPLVFILFLNFDIKGNSKSIALYSTSIYLVHLLVLVQLEALTQLQGSMLTLATLVISIAISFVLVAVNRRVKYLL